MAPRALSTKDSHERRGAWKLRGVAPRVPDRGGVDAGGVGESGRSERARDRRSRARCEAVSALPHAAVPRRGAGARAGGTIVARRRWTAAAAIPRACSQDGDLALWAL